MTTFKIKIERLEEEVGCAIPADYKEFLRLNRDGLLHKPVFSYTQQNGRVGQSCIVFFFSIYREDAQHSVLLNNRFYSENNRIPKGVVPIAIDIADNLVCLDMRPIAGRIVYWNHEEEFRKNNGISPLADSLKDFLSALSPEEKNG